MFFVDPWVHSKITYILNCKWLFISDQQGNHLKDVILKESNWGLFLFILFPVCVYIYSSFVFSMFPGWLFIFFNNVFSVIKLVVTVTITSGLWYFRALLCKAIHNFVFSYSTVWRDPFSIMYLFSFCSIFIILWISFRTWCVW